MSSANIQLQDENKLILDLLDELRVTTLNADWDKAKALISSFSFKDESMLSKYQNVLLQLRTDYSNREFNRIWKKHVHQAFNTLKQDAKNG